MGRRSFVKEGQEQRYRGRWLALQGDGDVAECGDEATKDFGSNQLDKVNHHGP